MCGVPAAAVSLCTFEDRDFEAAAELGVRLMDWALEHPLPRGEIYNLNVPFQKEIKGIRPASVSNEFICAAVYKPLPDGSYVIKDVPNDLPETDPSSDLLLTHDGYATVSILSWNLQAHTALKDVESIKMGE